MQVISYYVVDELIVASSKDFLNKKKYAMFLAKVKLLLKNRQISFKFDLIQNILMKRCKQERRGKKRYKEHIREKNDYF